MDQKGQDETWDLILHTDWERWSGSRKEETEQVQMPAGGEVTFYLPPFSGALYQISTR